MSIDVTNESLCINKLVGHKSETVVVEGDIIVPDVKPDILNTINTTGNVCVYKKEVLDGKVRIDGNVNIYAIYLADNQEEATRSLNSNIDFTQIIDFPEASSQMSLEDRVTIKAMECKILNGRKITVKVTLQFELKLYFNETVEIVKQVNNLRDIQALESELQINSLIGEGTTRAYAKDTVVIDNIDNLAEILKVNLDLVNKDTKVSYNKVLGKADVYVKMMYLTEDNRIKVCENKIPVMGFVDIENVTDTDLCDMRYELKNMIVKPNAVEEHSIYVEAEIELSCRVYQNKQIQWIQDMYSPSEELVCKQREINTMSQKNCIKHTCNVKEKIALPELGTNPLYDVEVKPILYKQTIVNSNILLEGEISLTFLFAANNGVGIRTKECRLPLEAKIEANNINLNTNVEVQIEVKNQDFVIGTDGSIDSKIELELSVDVSNTIGVNLIHEVTLEETRQREIYSMIIYFVRSGDSLWKIAKRFKSTVEDIARVNNIEDVNKIFPGQQLFIPKYVYTKTSQSA